MKNLPLVALALLLAGWCAPLAAQPVPPSPFGEAYLVGDFQPGFPGSEIERLCLLGEGGPADRLLFITGVDRRLWVTDGTPRGTLELLPPGESAVFFLRCEDDGAFFQGSPLDATAPLWWTDGTAAGTHRLIDDAAMPYMSGALPDGRHLVAGVAGEGDPPPPWTLWVTDRTPAGTHEIPLGIAGDPRRLAVVGERVLIQIQGGGERPQNHLWVSDGTAGGTRLLADLGEGSEWIITVDPFGGQATFLVRRGPTPTEGALELWRTDGTAAGTRKLSVDLPARSTISAERQVLATPGGERLAFVLGSGTHVDDRQQLWVTDGTAAGTRLLVENGIVRPGAVVPPFAEELVPFGGRFYFPLDDGVSGEELWSTDLTPAGTRQVMDLCPGPCSSGARIVAPYGDRVLLAASSPELGEELWVSDLTLAGTRPVADLCPGTCSSRPHHVVQPAGADGWTLFAARPVGIFQGREQLWTVPPPDDVLSPLLWPPRPRRATDFPASDGFHARQPISPVAVLDRQVLFVHGTDDYGSELWSLPLTDHPPPPPGDPLESPAVPGFRFQVRITAAPGTTPIAGTLEPECIPETVCVSGALPGRAEVFIRVVGPKPNGFLWPTLVKFTTSTVEVWIERIETGATRYYVLSGARPGIDELPGLFDRTGFRL